MSVKSLDLSPLILSGKRRQEDSEAPGNKHARSQSPWGSEPRDIIEKISSFLHMRDVAHVHGVCKAWRDIYPIDGGFDFSGLKITGAILTQIKNALVAQNQTQAHITALDLSYCPLIKDADLKALKGLPCLTDLNLSHCDVSFNGMKSLKNLPVKVLNLSRCRKIDDKALEHLKTLSAMRCLDLTDCNITGDVLKLLKGIPLEEISLKGWRKIGLVGLKHLQAFPLKKLNLHRKERSNEITDAMLEHVKKLPLKSLDMSRCSDITPFGLQHLREMRLEQLVLRHSNDPLAVLQLVQKHPLKSVILQGSDVTPECLVLLQHCAVEELDLGGCTDLADDALRALSQMPLRKLSLSACGSGAVAHLKELPLTDLHLMGWFNDKDIIAFLKAFPLQSLQMTGCPFNSAILAQLQAMSLKSLTLSETALFDEDLIALRALPLDTLDTSGATYGISYFGF